jgi:aarF domain-containing kinase
MYVCTVYIARVFDAALAGGGAKSINFQELAADLAEITFEFPFRIPPYFALIIRAISVLEGIALVGNPEFAIVDEAYPYISRRLMTDDSPRLKAAFKYMIYGRGDTWDVDRIIDMLQALEKFVAVKDFGDGSAFKANGVRGNTFVGGAGDARGTKKVVVSEADPSMGGLVQSASSSSSSLVPTPGNKPDSTNQGREALKFFFSNEGALFRDFLIDEICGAVDALSRDAARELFFRVGPGSALTTAFPDFRPPGLRTASRTPFFFRAVAPPLTEKDRRVVESMTKLINFLLEELPGNPRDNLSSSRGLRDIFSSVRRTRNRELLNDYIPILREFAPSMRSFGLQIAAKLSEKLAVRVIRASADAVFGEDSTGSAPSRKEESVPPASTPREDMYIFRQPNRNSNANTPQAVPVRNQRL